MVGITLSPDRHRDGALGSLDHVPGSARSDGIDNVHQSVLTVNDKTSAIPILQTQRFEPESRGVEIEAGDPVSTAGLLGGIGIEFDVGLHEAPDEIRLLLTDQLLALVPRGESDLLFVLIAMHDRPAPPEKSRRHVAAAPHRRSGELSQTRDLA